MTTTCRGAPAARRSPERRRSRGSGTTFRRCHRTLCLAGVLLWACTAREAEGPSAPVPPLGGERRLVDLHQLTFEGENAEAYFSGDGQQLIFQSTHGEWKCDQIFTMKVDGSGRRLVSTGKGRTTCAYYFPDGRRIIYASTHLEDTDCPPPPPRRGRYVWAIYKSYDIFSARPDGSDLRRLTDAPGYDAEATVAPDGSKIVFTSARDGDLEIYSMNPDGSDQRRLTYTVGYDGGPFYSPDGEMICFRASRPPDDAARKLYRDLLAEGLVEPTELEIFVMDAGGGNVRQITRNGKANFCPFFHPSGRQIIFSSNQGDPQGRIFDLYLVDLETGAQEQVTFNPSFDGFPMFSPDGSKLVWASNRRNRRPHDTNIFVADWIE